MKKGFTLLELIIVIIIIGILATIALANYLRMVEKARGSEARAVIGHLRTGAAAWLLDHSDLTAYVTSIQTNDVQDIPPDCAATHYFHYTVSSDGALHFTVRADRCDANGKEPQGDATHNVVADMDFTQGSSTPTNEVIVSTPADFY